MKTQFVFRCYAAALLLAVSSLAAPVFAEPQGVESNTPVSEKRGGWKPFWATIFMGNRIGLEYNEGRKWRPVEVIRGIPVLGFIIMLPKFCAEALSLNRMQHIANETGIDEARRVRYQQKIDLAFSRGDLRAAELLKENSPLDENNYPTRKKTFGNRMQAGMIELLVGHRDALEWNEGRKIRKVEWASILIVPRIFPAIEAFKGKQMQEVARLENLDPYAGKTLALD